MAPPPVPRWLLPVVILVSLATRLPNLDGRLADHDSWRQTDTATIARNFLDEPHILYPRINWGAPGPGYVEAEFQLYSYTVHVLYRLVGEQPILGRLLSLLLTGLSAVVVHRLARRYLAPWPAVLATVVFLATPLVFRYSRAFMPEATVLFFYLVALVKYLEFLDADHWRDLLASAAAMALAVLVKPTSIHLGLVLILLTAQQRGARQLLGDTCVAFAAISLLPGLAYYVHAAHLHAEFGNTFGVISGGDSKWGGWFYWSNPDFYARLFRMERWHVLGDKTGALLALVGAVFARGALRRLVYTWCATVFLYYLIVARYAGYDRGLQYHVYAAPLAAIVLVAGAVAIFHTLERIGFRRLGYVTAAASVLLLLSADGRTNAQWLFSRAGARQLEAGRALARVSAPGDLVAVVSSDVATDRETGVPNNFEEPDVFFHANRRGRALAADQLTGATLERCLDLGVRWLVTYEALERRQDGAFNRLVAKRMELAATGDGFRIYRARAHRPAG